MIRVRCWPSPEIRQFVSRQISPETIAVFHDEPVGSVALPAQDSSRTVDLGDQPVSGWSVSREQVSQVEVPVTEACPVEGIHEVPNRRQQPAPVRVGQRSEEVLHGISRPGPSHENRATELAGPGASLCQAERLGRLEAAHDHPLQGRIFAPSPRSGEPGSPEPASATIHRRWVVVNLDVAIDARDDSTACPRRSRGADQGTGGLRSEFVRNGCRPARCRGPKDLSPDFPGTQIQEFARGGDHNVMLAAGLLSLRDVRGDLGACPHAERRR